MDDTSTPGPEGGADQQAPGPLPDTPSGASPQHAAERPPTRGKTPPEESNGKKTSSPHPTLIPPAFVPGGFESFTQPQHPAHHDHLPPRRQAPSNPTLPSAPLNPSLAPRPAPQVSPPVGLPPSPRGTHSRARDPGSRSTGCPDHAPTTAPDWWDGPSRWSPARLRRTARSLRLEAEFYEALAERAERDGE